MNLRTASFKLKFNKDLWVTVLDSVAGVIEPSCNYPVISMGAPVDDQRSFWINGAKRIPLRSNLAPYGLGCLDDIGSPDCQIDATAVLGSSVNAYITGVTAGDWIQFDWMHLDTYPSDSVDQLVIALWPKATGAADNWFAGLRCNMVNL
jgi:hypothetical protein